MAVVTQSPRVADFVSNFRGGGARPNRYEVIMTFPQKVNSSYAPTKLGFTCKATSIPGSTMEAVTVPYMGREVKVAGDRTWEDWTVTIINDVDFIVRDTFEKWMDRINGHESNIAIKGWQNPSNYYSTATVAQTDREGNIVKTYEVDQLFPTTIGSIELGYENNNSIEEFEVTFAFNWWKTRTTT